MKIGITTHFHRTKNYGGVLQAYALPKFLNGVMDGCAAQIRFGTFGQDAHALFFPRVYEKFEEFYSLIPQIEQQIGYEDELSILEDKLDVFLTGSDQVWNPSWFYPQFYLQGINKRKIAYAASVGIGTLTREEQKIIPLIQKIDYVSVREKTAERLIQKYSGKRVTTVVDPVLLLSAKQWWELQNLEFHKSNYAFAHFLGTGMAGRNESIRLAKGMNISLIHIPYLSQFYNNFDELWGDYKYEEAGPCEFLGLIANSNVVFTDSFHAMVFSIIFQKQFLVFERKDSTIKSMNSRIYDFLKDLDLLDRIVKEGDSGIERVLTKVIDYDKVTKVIEGKKLHSLGFLQRAFKETELESPLSKYTFG